LDIAVHIIGFLTFSERAFFHMPEIVGCSKNVYRMLEWTY
jgi:hypothetical protein